MSRVNMAREIRSRHVSRSLAVKREKGWDNRFVLGKIPDYNAHNDKYFIGMRLFNENHKVIDNYKTDYIVPQFRNFSSSSLRNNQNSYMRGYKILNEEEEGMNDAITRIQYLWNQLGVLEDYRQLFGVVSNQLDDGNRFDFFKNEIESLKLLFELLTTLTKEIQEREELIIGLQQLNSDLGYMLLNNQYRIEDSFFNDVIEKMRLIRTSTISIVQIMVQIRENCSYRILGGKIDLNQLSTKFLFDKNYLIKMKEQLDFLKRSNLRNFFNLTEGDPFLLQPTEPNTKDSRLVPVSDEEMIEIKKCKYFILEDLIYYQLGNLKCNIFRTISPIATKGRANESYKQYISNGFFPKTKNGGKKYHKSSQVFYNKNSYGLSTPGAQNDINNQSIPSKTDGKKLTETGKNASFRQTNSEFVSKNNSNQDKQYALLDKDSLGSKPTPNIKLLQANLNSKNRQEGSNTNDQQMSNSNKDEASSKRNDGDSTHNKKREDSLRTLNKPEADERKVIKENSHEDESKEDPLKQKEIKTYMRDKKSEIMNVQKLLNDDHERPQIQVIKRRSVNKDEIINKDKVPVKVLNNKQDGSASSKRDSDRYLSNRDKDIKENEDKEKAAKKAQEKELLSQIEKEAKVQKDKYIKKKEEKDKEIEELKRQIKEKDEQLKKNDSKKKSKEGLNHNPREKVQKIEIEVKPKEYSEDQRIKDNNELGSEEYERVIENETDRINNKKKAEEINKEAENIDEDIEIDTVDKDKEKKMSKIKDDSKENQETIRSNDKMILTPEIKLNESKDEEIYHSNEEINQKLKGEEKEEEKQIVDDNKFKPISYKAETEDKGNQYDSRDFIEKKEKKTIENQTVKTEDKLIQTSYINEDKNEDDKNKTEDKEAQTSFKQSNLEEKNTIDKKDEIIQTSVLKTDSKHIATETNKLEEEDNKFKQLSEEKEIDALKKEKIIDDNKAPFEEEISNKNKHQDDTSKDFVSLDHQINALPDHNPNEKKEDVIKKESQISHDNQQDEDTIKKTEEDKQKDKGKILQVYEDKIEQEDDNQKLLNEKNNNMLDLASNNHIEEEKKSELVELNIMLKEDLAISNDTNSKHKLQIDNPIKENNTITDEKKSEKEEDKTNQLNKDEPVYFTTDLRQNPRVILGILPLYDDIITYKEDNNDLINRSQNSEIYKKEEEVEVKEIEQISNEDITKKEKEISQIIEVNDQQINENKENVINKEKPIELVTEEIEKEQIEEAIKQKGIENKKQSIDESTEQKLNPIELIEKEPVVIESKAQENNLSIVESKEKEAIQVENNGKDLNQVVIEQKDRDNEPIQVLIEENNKDKESIQVVKEKEVEPLQIYQKQKVIVGILPLYEDIIFYKEDPNDIIKIFEDNEIINKEQKDIEEAKSGEIPQQLKEEKEPLKDNIIDEVKKEDILQQQIEIDKNETVVKEEDKAKEELKVSINKDIKEDEVKIKSIPHETSIQIIPKEVETVKEKTEEIIENNVKPEEDFNKDQGKENKNEEEIKDQIKETKEEKEIKQEEASIQMQHQNQPEINNEDSSQQIKQKENSKDNIQQEPLLLNKDNAETQQKQLIPLDNNTKEEIVNSNDKEMNKEEGIIKNDKPTESQENISQKEISKQEENSNKNKLPQLLPLYEDMIIYHEENDELFKEKSKEQDQEIISDDVLDDKIKVNNEIIPSELLLAQSNDEKKEEQMMQKDKKDDIDDKKPEIFIEDNKEIKQPLDNNEEGNNNIVNHNEQMIQIQDSNKKDEAQIDKPKEESQIRYESQTELIIYEKQHESQIEKKEDDNDIVQSKQLIEDEIKENKPEDVVDIVQIVQSSQIKMESENDKEKLSEEEKNRDIVLKQNENESIQPMNEEINENKAIVVVDNENQKDETEKINEIQIKQPEVEDVNSENKIDIVKEDQKKPQKEKEVNEEIQKEENNKETQNGGNIPLTVEEESKVNKSQENNTNTKIDDAIEKVIQRSQTFKDENKLLEINQNERVVGNKIESKQEEKKDEEKTIKEVEVKEDKIVKEDNQSDNKDGRPQSASRIPKKTESIDQLPKKVQTLEIKTLPKDIKINEEVKDQQNNYHDNIIKDEAILKDNSQEIKEASQHNDEKIRNNDPLNNRPQSASKGIINKENIEALPKRMPTQEIKFNQDIFNRKPDEIIQSNILEKRQEIQLSADKEELIKNYNEEPLKETFKQEETLIKQKEIIKNDMRPKSATQAVLKKEIPNSTQQRMLSQENKIEEDRLSKEPKELRKSKIEEKENNAQVHIVQDDINKEIEDQQLIKGQQNKEEEKKKIMRPQSATKRITDKQRDSPQRMLTEQLKQTEDLMNNTINEDNMIKEQSSKNTIEQKPLLDNTPEEQIKDEKTLKNELRANVNNEENKLIKRPQSETKRIIKQELPEKIPEILQTDYNKINNKQNESVKLNKAIANQNEFINKNDVKTSNNQTPRIQTLQNQTPKSQKSDVNIQKKKSSKIQTPTKEQMQKDSLQNQTPRSQAPLIQTLKIESHNEQLQTEKSVHIRIGTINDKDNEIIKTKERQKLDEKENNTLEKEENLKELTIKSNNLSQKDSIKEEKIINEGTNIQIVKKPTIPKDDEALKPEAKQEEINVSKVNKELKLDNAQSNNINDNEIKQNDFININVKEDIKESPKHGNNELIKEDNNKRDCNIETPIQIGSSNLDQKEGKGDNN